MKNFNYKAKDKTGKLIKGLVEAPDAQAAAKLVRAKGYLVLNITPARDSIGSLLNKIKNRVTSSDITTFTRQFSTMINAGLPVTEALSILRSQSKTSMQAIVNQILADVEGGESLSTSLARYEKIFSTTYIALVKAGEAGGVLDNVLNRLADNMEKQEEFKGKVKGALIYPAIIVTGMVAVGFIMMVFVIPKLTALYKDFNAELPLPTRILMGISGAVITFWPLFAGGGVLGYWAFSAYRKTDKGRHETDKWIFKIPIFGELQKQIILTELTRTLALMVGSGVSILEGLAVTAEVVKNTVISDALKDASEQIEKGFPIAFSFAKHPDAFPYIMSQMIAVGEETGKMEDVLNKVSRIFEVESDQKVKGLTAAIEPLVMILLGLGVGFLVIAVILPIYNLTSQF
ncbi:type II secretion system F family protein [Candidatus Microgenomates bacterium]|nr:type II secretion system F family protein [Candidatus Microgenomates bacterium]